MKRIRSLKALAKAVEERRAVICPRYRWAGAWHRPQPAAWVIHLPACQVLRMIDAGLYLYERPAQKRGR